MIKKLLINLRYLLAPTAISLALYGVAQGGVLSWLGVFMLGAAIIVDTLVKTQTRGAGFDENGKTNAVAWFQNLTMYVMLPLFIGLQIALAFQVSGFMAGVVSLTELIGSTLSAGIFLGIGIIYGHELAHTKGFSFVIARMMMALSGKAHFCYAHVYNHHLELGHEDDPATSPRGRTLYKHYPLSGLGQSKFLFMMEKQRLERLGKYFLSFDNRWIRGYLMSLPTVFLFWFVGGWVGMAVLATMWLISNFELETLNYLEHYGLYREKGQPIDYRHSWDNSTAFSSWFFIEIGRQGDHHDRGETHFWELDEVGAPNTGHGYFQLFALALVPPVFFRMINEYLTIWDKEMASEGEIKIAKKIK
jgi:hypothetical protein